MGTTDVTAKNYRKLSIAVSLRGLSFCVVDTLQDMVVAVSEIAFETVATPTNTEDLFAAAFDAKPELRAQYDEIVVLHSNNLCTFVPQALFDEQYLGSYLQYNTRVFESDFFAFDALDYYQMNLVYIPYVHINNFFIDHFGAFTYKHASSILVSRLLDASKNKDEKKMVVHFGAGSFEIVVLQNQQLLLFNSFDCATPEDFLYYILFTAEQLHMNPEVFELELLGSIIPSDAYYQLAYKYVRNISLYDTAHLQQQNSLEAAENRKHFILLQA